MSHEDQEMLQDFCHEARDLLEEAEQSLLAIDNGQDYKQHFDKIYRAFHSTKGGAGMLGLTEVNKIVHFMEDILTETHKKGRLGSKLIDFFLDGIDSTRKAMKGERHDFSFDSPFDQKVEAPERGSGQRKEVKRVIPAQPRIFHLDDEPDLGFLVGDLLRSEGYGVETFVGGAAMLTALKENPPDALIVDYNMPEQSGLEVMKDVRAIDHNIPVIMLSGYLTKDVCIDALSQGAFALLEKPIKDEVLLMTLSNAVRFNRSNRLVSRSINLLMYQFSDLDEFLRKMGKKHIRETIVSEIHNLIHLRKELRGIQKG